MSVECPLEVVSEDDYRRVHFSVMAIEACAQHEHVSGPAMYQRLKAQDLIRQRLFRFYEQLHTQSLDYVVNDTLETLANWEKETEQ